MFVSHQALRVFVYKKPIDMRFSFERLCCLIRQDFACDVDLGHVYLFLGKNRKRAKVLTFDGTGLLLIHKRLEFGRFKELSQLAEQISASHLAVLLEGDGQKMPNKLQKMLNHPGPAIEKTSNNLYTS